MFDEMEDRCRNCGHSSESHNIYNLAMPCRVESCKCDFCVCELAEVRREFRRNRYPGRDNPTPPFIAKRRRGSAIEK